MFNKIINKKYILWIVVFILASAYMFGIKPAFIAFSTSPNISFPDGITAETASPIGSHFEEAGRFFVLTTEYEHVHPSPQDNPINGNSLPPSTRVMVVDKDIITNESWVFVTTPDKAPIGWIRDASIAYKDRFQKRRSWPFGHLSFKKGGYVAHYTIYQNASFINRWQSQSDGIQLSGVRKGHMLEYNGIIYAKQNRDYINKTFFMINPETSDITLEALYSTIPLTK